MISLTQRPRKRNPIETENRPGGARGWEEGEGEVAANSCHNPAGNGHIWSHTEVTMVAHCQGRTRCRSTMRSNSIHFVFYKFHCSFLNREQVGDYITKLRPWEGRGKGGLEEKESSGKQGGLEVHLDGQSRGE